MRTDKSISINEIKFRNRAIHSTTENSDAGNLYEIAQSSIENNKSTLKNDVYKFFQECTDKYNAERYGIKCMTIMVDLKENASLLSILENKFSHEILPYISDLDAVKQQCHRLNLAESTVASIDNAVKINKICDRIVSNDYKLSKRFNFSKYIKENTYKPFDHVVIECCKMIDTYDTPAYAKMNIAIEELSYIYQNNAIKYDSKRMIQLISEYFINVPNSDIKELQTVLKENLCISESDISDNILLREEVEENNSEHVNPYDVSKSVDNINKCIIIFNNFKAKQSKAIENFKEAINLISNEPVHYQIDALSQIFEWLRNFGIDLFISNYDELTDIIFKYLEFLTDKAKSDPLQCANKLLLIINSEMINLHKIEDFEQKYSKYYWILSDIANSIETFNTIKPSESEAVYESKLTDLANMAKLKGAKFLERTKDKVVANLKDFKLFKFENIINYSHKVSKKLRNEEGKFMNKVKGKVKDIFRSAKNWINEDFDMSTIQEANILDCITNRGNFDYVLAIYEATDYKYINDIRLALDEFCRENSEDSMLTYYVENDMFFEIHIADTTLIELTEEEEQKRISIFTEAEQAYCGYIIDTLETIEKLNEIDAIQLAEDFSKIEYCLTSDAVLGIIESSKYLYDMIPYARLEEIANTYADNNPTDYMGNTAISQALSSWKLEESSLEMATETVYLLREAIDETMLTEAKINTKVDTSINGNNKNTDKKEDNTKDDKSLGSKIKDKVSNAKDSAVDGAKKIQKTKINLNTLKYAMEDLRLKSKNAGDKAQNITKTLNIYVEKFITAMRKLYTNDNREQIIRGSIIPSFHQLIGRLLVIGVASAGAGFFFASSSMALFTAVVTAFGTIAASKHSTDKERALMLDEIAIEIDVCEKEMQKAEANGKLKTYRALSYRMTKLKREYQRIRYNVGFKEYKHNPVVGTDKPVIARLD